MSLEETQPLLNPRLTSEDEDSPRFRISQSCRRKIAGTTILLTLTFERMAFYSIISNLYLYLNRTPLDWLPYNAMNASYVFTGVTYLTSVIGGWLADSVLGKFKTVILGLLIYCGGYSVVTFMASYGQAITELCPLIPLSNISDSNSGPEPGVLDLHAVYSDSSAEKGIYNGGKQTFRNVESHSGGQDICGWLVYLVLVTIGISVGVFRANIAPFGADQFKDVGNDVMRRFFNWYYWCINIGSFVAVGLMAYIQQEFTNGFFISFLACTVALGVALIVFICGRPWYVVQKPSGSVLTDIFKIIKEACRSRRRHKINVRRHISLRVDLPSPSEATITTPSCLDMAKVRYGGSYHESAVEDVKALGKLVIIFMALVPYWMVYFQMQTSFLAQGLHMKLNPFANHTYDNSTLYTNSFRIPAAWLTLFDVIFLLILLPVMDKIVYPFLDKHGIHMGLLFKISLGMTFALLSVVVAGGLEFYRLDLINDDDSNVIIQVVGNTSYVAADLLIFWQVPQYAFIGISEVFASVTSLEFAYSQSPKSMQGIIMGLYCFSTGVGSFMGTGLLQLVSPYWLSKHHGNVNESHFDYYFFLLGGIQFVAIIVFNLVAKVCKIQDEPNFKFKRQNPTTLAPPSPSLPQDQGIMSANRSRRMIITPARRN